MDDSLLFWVNQSYLLYVKYVFKSAKAMDAYVTSIMKQHTHTWSGSYPTNTCLYVQSQKTPETPETSRNKKNNDLVQMHDLRPGFQDKTYYSIAVN